MKAAINNSKDLLNVDSNDLKNLYESRCGKISFTALLLNVSICIVTWHKYVFQRKLILSSANKVVLYTCKYGI